MTIDEMGQTPLEIAADLERLGAVASADGNLMLLRLSQKVLRTRRAQLTGTEGPHTVPLELPELGDVLAVDLDSLCLGCDALAGRAMTRGGHGEFWLTLGDILRAELNRRRRLVLETLSR